MLEKALYSRVAQLSKRTLACAFVHQNVGTGLGKIDIVGIQELWGDLESDLEIVAIEVKGQSPRFLNSVGQAVAYSVYAHRCYLAVHKLRAQGFTEDERQVAAQFGIGLINVGSKEISVTLPSRRFAPESRNILHLMHRLGLFRCALCRSAYPYTQVTEINARHAIDLSQAPAYQSLLRQSIVNRRHSKYYLYDLADRRGDNRQYVYDRRYLCKDCTSIFASLIVKPKGGV